MIHNDMDTHGKHTIKTMDNHNEKTQSINRLNGRRQQLCNKLPEGMDLYRDRATSVNLSYRVIGVIVIMMIILCDYCHS